MEFNSCKIEKRKKKSAIRDFVAVINNVRHKSGQLKHEIKFNRKHHNLLKEGDEITQNTFNKNVSKVFTTGVKDDSCSVKNFIQM